MIETLDWFSELLLRRPWHSVGVVIALNVAVVALWIAFEKRRDAKRRDGATRKSEYGR